MSFSESLELGIIGERLIQEEFGVQMVLFEENPDSQRNGVDGTRGCVTHEVKTRGPDTIKHYVNGPDIIIETISIREGDVPGWIYTSKADILFYGVLNQQLDGWLYLWRIDLQKLQNWWKKQDEEKFPIRIAETEDSHSTENRVVPFSAIPDSLWRRLYRDRRVADPLERSTLLGELI